MKQTIRTKNYNAIIQIPYQKLARKSNCINLDTFQPEQDCAGKTLVISNCNACCQPKQNTVSLEMLEELEQAFETDMRDKDERIGVLGKDIDKLRLQLTANMGQKQKYKGEYEKCKSQLTQEQGKYLQAVKNIKYLDDQMVKIRILNREKDNTISQLQKKQQKLLAKIGEFEEKQKFHQEKYRLLQSNIVSLENIVKNKDIEIQSKVKFEKQNEILNRTLIHYMDKIGHLEEAIQALEASDTKNKQTISEKDEKIGKLHSIIGENQEIIKNKVSECEQKQRKIDNLFQKIYENEDSIALLTQKLSRTYQMSTNYTQLQLDYQYLIQKARDSQLYITSLLQQIVEKKNKISDLQHIIFKKQEQIKAKDNPKMYQVKIEKVIDRQDYINKLENQLETVRRNGLDLEERIKGLEGLIADKDKLLGEYHMRIEELEEKILKLTKYIQQKESSFAWVVEREIAKDIQLNKNEANRAYKVYPSEPKPANMFMQQSSPQVSQQRSQYDNIILHPRIDSVNILSQLENNTHQFRRIVEGGAQQRR